MQDYKAEKLVCPPQQALTPSKSLAVTIISDCMQRHHQGSGTKVKWSRFEGLSVKLLWPVGPAFQIRPDSNSPNTNAAESVVPHCDVFDDIGPFMDRELPTWLNISLLHLD